MESASVPSDFPGIYFPDAFFQVCDHYVYGTYKAVENESLSSININLLKINNSLMINPALDANNW
jgi:hypothetical protein